jgi:hypothetical protein
VTGARDRTPARFRRAGERRAEQPITGDQRHGRGPGLGGEPIEAHPHGDHAHRTVRATDGRTGQEIRAAVENRSARLGVAGVAASAGSRLSVGGRWASVAPPASAMTTQSAGPSSPSVRIRLAPRVRAAGSWRTTPSKTAASWESSPASRRTSDSASSSGARAASVRASTVAASRVELAREPEPPPTRTAGQPTRGGARPRSTQRRSPIRCSFMRLVVPATHMGEPE